MGRRNALQKKREANKEKVKRKAETKKLVQKARARKEKKEGRGVKRPAGDLNQPPAKRAKTQSDSQATVDDTTIGEEDEQFFQERGGRVISFVEGVDKAQNSKERKLRGRKLKKFIKEEKNRPALWEETRKNKKWHEHDSDKLPTKRLDGTVVMAKIPNKAEAEEEIENEGGDEEEEEEEDQDQDLDGDSIESDEEQEEHHHGELDDELEILNEETIDDPEKLKVKLFFQRQHQMKEFKEKLAVLASEILENPEKLSKLANFRQMCDSTTDPALKKLTILSELAVFKDIIPGYRIRLPTEAEAKVKVTQDVAQVRSYEQGLLNAYQNYLKYLETLIKQAPKKDYAKDAPGNSLTGIAVKCVGRLLVDLPHFNFRSNLIVTLLPLSDSKCDEISEIVVNAFRALFETDNRTDATLEVVKKLSKYVKSKNFNVRPEVISSFVYLPLTSELPEGTDFNTGLLPSTNKMSKKAKKKKKNKIEMQLQKEFQEAKAEQDKDHAKYIQTETLKAIFLTYFRILKSSTNSQLLPTVLQGLSRFCHLINIELLLDLLEVLRKMVKNAAIAEQEEEDGETETYRLDTASRIHCAITAFQTLRAQGQALTIDLKEFYSSMYGALWDLIPASITQDSLIRPTLKCLQMMFYDTKQISIERIAAFIKRILTVSLYMTPNASLGYLEIVRNLLTRYPKTQHLLDNEFKGSGQFLGDIDDPEHCNAFAATAWEFALLNVHTHKPLAQFSRLVSAQTQVEGVRYSAEELFNFYAPNIGPVDIPTGKGISFTFPEIPNPPQHRIEKQMKKEANNKEKCWFITNENFVATPFLFNTKQEYESKIDPEKDLQILFSGLWPNK